MGRRSKRAIGVNDLLGKRFETLPFEGEWAETFGNPEKNFKAIVYGDSGSGKTDFVVKLTKYLTNFGKVYYNSFEEGVSKTLQDAFVRNEMWDVQGKVIIGDRDTFEEVFKRMGRRNSPKFCIIDSLDYMKLTVEQYKELDKVYRHKSFIIITWSAGRYPKTQTGKDIEYMCDIKIRTHEYKAFPRSRFGGNKPFVIWPEYWKKKRAEAEEAARKLVEQKAAQDEAT